VVFLVLLAGIGLLFLVPADEPEPLDRLNAPIIEARLTPPLTAEDLEGKLRQVASTHAGSYGAVVYDPASDRSVSLDADRTFTAASLAKLPALITLYRAAARDDLDLDEKITMLPSDVTAYGSGVLSGHPPGETMTLRKCAEYLIKHSDNTAWVMLDRRLGKEEIKTELTALGATDTDYEALTTTPNDVLLMLRAIADPAFTTPELSNEMLDTMTDTAYEDRLPQPLPEGTRVAHKIGSYEDAFSDAGIVYPEDDEGDNYFIVVMSKHTTEDDARSAIRTMSLATYRTLAGTPQTNR